MSKRNLALIGATIVSIIYGVTFTIAKDVMPKYIDAYGFILLRAGGSMLLFWLVWLFMPKEKIALNDFPRNYSGFDWNSFLNPLRKIHWRQRPIRTG